MRRRQKIATAISKLITQMVETFGGTRIAFAKLAGLTAAQLSRMMNPTKSDRPPGVLSCLKLSRASGVNVVYVLKVAGHHEYAVVLQDITGPIDTATRSLVTGAELDMVRAMRTLNPQVQHSIVFLIQRAAEERDQAIPTDLLIAQQKEA